MKPGSHSSAAYAQPDREPLPGLHGPQILLAEDDEDLRSLLASALQGHGYTVVEVDTGRALLARLEDWFERGAGGAPDLVISDFRMPEVSGLEVLRRVRGRGWTMPFILITAFGDDQIMAQATRIGATGVMSKPFSLEELYDTVSSALSGTGRGAATRAGRRRDRSTDEEYE